MALTPRPTIRAERGRARAGRRDEDRRGGQALAEFALVVPVLFLLIAGIIQYGLFFWSQQTLTQIARDTGRWAATQTFCDDSASVTATANDIAAKSTLFGYAANQWVDGGLGTTNKVAVSWPDTPCPPTSNQDVAWVQVQIDHQIPIFFPLVPGDGQLSTTAEFRMEPEPT